MKRRTNRRRLAGAVVVTLAAAGCGASSGSPEGECCHNPPYVPPFTGLATGDRVRRRDDGTCSQYVATTGLDSMVACPSSLARPGTVHRNGDGCTFMPDMDCPPPSEATCNPPPPMPIPCPTE